MVTTAKTTHFQGQTTREHVISFYWFLCRVHGIFCDPKFNVIFAENLHGRLLRPYLWRRLVTTAQMTHFKCQRSKSRKTHIWPIFVCYRPWNFCDLEFSTNFCVPRENGHIFKFKRATKQVKKCNFSNFCVLVHEFL